MSCQVLGQPTTGPDIANMEEELKQKEKRLNAWQERLEKEKEIIFALSPEHPERGCRLQILASDKAALASAWQALVQDKERLQQEAAAARSGRSAHDAPPGDTVNTLAAVMSELAAVKAEAIAGNLLARQGLAEATEAKRQASYVQAELIQTQHLLFVASHTSQHHSDIGQVSIGSSHTAKYQVVHPDLKRLPLAELRDNDDREQRVCTAIARAFPQVTASGITYRVFCNMFKGGGDGDQAEQQQGEMPATSAGLGKRQGKRQRGASKGLQPDEAELLRVNGTPALTLVDLCGAMAIKQQPNGVFKEDPHMQEPTFRMLQAMAAALEWDVCMVDTHSPAEQFQNPAGRPDAVGMDPKLSSMGSRRQWALVVIPFEFKLGDTASVLAEGTGQLAERSYAMFSAQLDRFVLVVVLLTMDSVEVKVFKLPSAVRDAAAAFASLREFEYSRSGPLPLYISPESPGLQLLVRVMISTPAQLGYSERPPLPSSPGGMPLSLGGYAVTDLVLERRGTAFNGGSWVFFGTACKGQEQLPAVLKLNVQPTEADVLMLVGGRPHLAHLLAQGQCCFCGVDYAAVLLSPLATHLSEQDTLETCVQVCYDVAAALETLQGLGFLHCDPTRNNIGKCTGRGVLFDYSAAQVINAEEPGLVPDAMSAGQAGQQPAPESPTMSLLTCTGTLQFVAVEQLLGAKPRMRSQLEQLAYSMFDVMTGGQLMGRKAVAHKQAQWWVGQKYAQFAQPKPSVAKAIREDFQPFLSDLLGLFWRQPADAQAGIGRLYYPGDVTVQQFQDVCLRHMSASARECMAEERKERAQMGGP